jgi:hypothetical protein
MHYALMGKTSMENFMKKILSIVGMLTMSASLLCMDRNHLFPLLGISGPNIELVGWLLEANVKSPAVTNFCTLEPREALAAYAFAKDSMEDFSTKFKAKITIADHFKHKLYEPGKRAECASSLKLLDGMCQNPDQQGNLRLYGEKEYLDLQKIKQNIPRELLLEQQLPQNKIPVDVVLTTPERYKKAANELGLVRKALGSFCTGVLTTVGLFAYTAHRHGLPATTVATSPDTIKNSLLAGAFCTVGTLAYTCCFTDAGNKCWNKLLLETEHETRTIDCASLLQDDQRELRWHQDRLIG